MSQELDTANTAAATVEIVRVQGVRLVLQAHVASIMRCTLPELRNVPPAAVYDRVMDNPRLLDRAFRHFRSRPDLFAEFTKDAAGVSVSSDDQPLQCGRTLRQVVELVVRACAKRYFRRHFLTALYAGPLGAVRLRLFLWFGFGSRGRQRAQHRAAKHYQAIGELLQHEWQARLIPVYATLPIATIQRLGAEILRHRDAAALYRAASGAAAAAPEVRIAEPAIRRWGDSPRMVGRSRHLSRHAREIEQAAASDALGRVLGALDVRARKALAMEISAVPDAVFRALTAEGLSPAEAVVFLFVAAHALGRVVFAELFMADGGPLRAQELTRRLAACRERERLSTVAQTMAVAPQAA